MKHSFFIFILLLQSLYTPLFGFKLIGLVPVRNEQIFIAQCLKALSRVTDAIIVLDDCSTDNTVQIIESLAPECNVINIIKKNSWYRNEPDDKNKLLDIGRKAGGTHFIMIDADEMLTANLLENNKLRAMIEKLQSGDMLSLCWIQLWRSVYNYRFDNSVWTWNYKTIIFADNKTASYSSEFIHTESVPHGLMGKRYQVKGYQYGLLHFQFINWRNLLIKQAWYRCLELIRFTHKSAQEINQRYAPSKDEHNLGLQPAKPEWFTGYDFFDPSSYDQREFWREKQVLAWFKEYGKSYFKDLDIWDIDWGVGL